MAKKCRKVEVMGEGELEGEGEGEEDLGDGPGGVERAKVIRCSTK